MENHSKLDSHALNSKMDDLAIFLNQFSSLTECHLVNFITHDLFGNLLPAELGDLLLQLSDDDLALLPSCELADKLISSDQEKFHALIEFLENCRRFNVENLLEDETVASYFSNVDDVCKMRKLRVSFCTDEKKSHEVEQMASAVATLAEIVGTDFVVDIGSGRGYLGSLLAMYYGLRVFGFDASDCNTHSASQRLERIQKDWKTALCRAGVDIVSCDAPKKKGYYQPITFAVAQSTTLDNSLNECQLREQDSIIVCGLHTCGDLAVHSLNMYVNCSRAKGLLLVGCCYHLMEEEFATNPFRKEDEQPPGFYGFPMSSRYRKRNFGIGRNSRVLACQPVSKLAQKATLPDRALHWRALIQQIVWDKLQHRVDIFERRVGRVAKRCKNFQEYVPKALKKLGFDFEISNDEIAQYENQFSEYERKMAAFFQLRCALAQPIETAILLDRLCYLLEQKNTLEAKLVPLFDPTLSPRCHAIWARKC